MGDEKLLAQLAECTESDCQRFLVDHLYENLGATQIERPGLNNRVEVLFTEEDHDYDEMINELHAYLDSVKKMVKPGCSEELLKVALRYMSSLVNVLSFMSLTSKLHSSL
ncbi:hypothetical protein TIFTF001_017725 [Ficus carica]|uniref:Uncharacterized protein n=1 Tax=Ficus carica TaxID=3494 RepID=A0AA88D8M3_FICCA|nr:hypothetical protein TIFTF001_017725 [Ficus carica]